MTGTGGHPDDALTCPFRDPVLRALAVRACLALISPWRYWQ